MIDFETKVKYPIRYTSDFKKNYKKMKNKMNDFLSGRICFVF